MPTDASPSPTAPTPSVATATKVRRTGKVREIVENSLGLAAVLALLIGLFSFKTTHFFSATIFQAIANEIPTAIFIASA